MSVFDYIINTIGMLLGILLHLYTYGKISGKKLKIKNAKDIIIIIIMHLVRY